YVLSGRIVVSYDQVKSDLPFQYLAHPLAGEYRFHDIGRLTRGHAIARQGLLIESNPQHGNVRLLLDIQIHYTLYFCHGVTNAARQIAQSHEAIAEYLNGNVGASPGEHIVDAVTDRLPDVETHAVNDRTATQNVLDLPR